MKRFFEEHTSVAIICIVISLLLCIIGCINNVNNDGTVTGKGLLKIVGDNLTDTMDTYQKQAVPNENLLKNSKGQFTLSPRNSGNENDKYNYQEFNFNSSINNYYTVSATVGDKTGNFDSCTIGFLDNNGSNYFCNNYVNAKIKDGKIVATLQKNRETQKSIIIYAGIVGNTRNNGMTLSNVKIEAGKKATSYIE